MEKYKKYKKDLPYSYVFGPFPTIELVKSKPELVSEVLISKDFNKKDELIKDLDEKSIPYRFDDKALSRISDKKKEYLAGVFKKYDSSLQAGNHLILDRVDNCGNLGTIIRSMLAFGYKDLALIGPCCDIFSPKTVRASMGAIFKIRFKSFANLAAYKKEFPENKIYSFLLNDKAKEFSKTDFISPFSLAFGNEGAGLSPEFFKENPVFIDQSLEVDSLNLPNAATIALYGLRRLDS